MVNYFDSPEAATLYARGRPFYHDGALATIAARLGWTAPLAHALDAGCGTGLSTRALLPYAKRITAVDASAEMLAVAYRDPRISYHHVPAERLPVSDASIDLLSLCEAFHWLDQEAFLSEAQRALVPGGILLVYGGGFRGEMDGIPQFASWFRDVHLPRYPVPPRNAPFSLDKGPPGGFELVLTDRQERSLPMTAFELADFFLTVSNTLQYLAESEETAAEHADFLVQELLPFYDGDPNGVRSMRFGGFYFVMRKV